MVGEHAWCHPLAFAHMHTCIHEYVQTHTCTELSYQSISLKRRLSARKVFFSPKGHMAVPGNIFSCQLTRLGGNYKGRGQGIVIYFTKNKIAHCPTCTHQRIFSLSVFSAKIEKPWLRKKIIKINFELEAYFNVIWPWWIHVGLYNHCFKRYVNIQLSFSKRISSNWIRTA